MAGTPKKHYLNSSFREKLIEHLFIGELLKLSWKRGLSLVQRAGLDVVSAIAAFLEKAEPERVEVARPEAVRVLGLIADSAEDEEVREASRSLRDNTM